MYNYVLLIFMQFFTTVDFNLWQVTIAFWKAIGGDEDELGDLSDLSDTEIP